MNNIPKNTFATIPCLTEESKHFLGTELCQTWFKGADKRYINEYLNKFIELNKQNFDFLSIQPVISGYGKNAYIYFKTSKNVGAIPLKSPINGKQIGDLIVIPRFFSKNAYNDYFSLLNLLKLENEVTTKDSIPLLSNFQYSPPFYLEAAKFIDSIASLINTNWAKFSTIEKRSLSPNGNTNWYKYFNSFHSIEDNLKYPNRYNLLTHHHKEYFNLYYIYKLCLDEISSHSTPLNLKYKYQEITLRISKFFLDFTPIATNSLHIRNSDSLLVKQSKQIGNNILGNKFTTNIAWSIDFAAVFEKYIQFLFTKVAQQFGGSIFNNPKIWSDSTVFRWQLKYLEPDILFKKNEQVIYIDAKYKSNYYNRSSSELKEDFRSDLHQILSYSSFNQSNKKIGFLVYPSEYREEKVINYSNKLTDSLCNVYLVGVPLYTSETNDNINFLYDLIKRI